MTVDELSVGDEIVAIKDVISLIVTNRKLITKGKTYKITKIKTNTIFVICDNSNNKTFRKDTLHLYFDINRNHFETLIQTLNKYEQWILQNTK